MGSRDLQRSQKRSRSTEERLCPWEAEKASTSESLLEKRQEIQQDKGRKEGGPGLKSYSSPKSMDQFSFLCETVHLFRFLLNVNTLTPES